MVTERDFGYQLDRAGSLILDATCALRAAGVLRLPPPHRRHLNSAISALDRAQLDLYKARHADPWSPPKHEPQLALL